MQFFSFGLTGGDTATGSIEELGGKGAGLVWMSQQGVPVPPGFILPTSVWAEYDQKPKATLKAIAKALPAYLYKLEAHFGYQPLLSVRSGARVSCPGMMDTILNVGIDGSNVAEWTTRLGPQCYGDSFLRLVQMYGSVVHGLRKESLGPTLSEALTFYTYKTGEAFPSAEAQLLGAIEAVFKSWDNERAAFYRREHQIPREWGTAVTVQAMVFGNLNEQSATGVLFTRNPNTGGMGVTGEWLPNAQGEDIVSGDRTPLSLETMKTWNPVVHDQLLSQVIALENQKKDMLDIEWTVQDGLLYLLQVRTGKRSATAALKIAMDLVQQGQIDGKTAVNRVSVQQFDLAQQSSLAPDFDTPAAYTGLAACTGLATGKPVFSKEEALKSKVPCILITELTTPDDIAGMKAAVGIITMTGGFTCHAAVNARAMDRACVVGVGTSVDVFKGLDVVSLDGSTGRIWTSVVPIVSGQTNGLVTAFKALVTKTLGIVPVVFDVPAQPLPTALLYLGDQILNPQAAGITVLKTLEKVDRLYLDLTPTAAEQAYLKLFAKLDPIQRMLTTLHTLVPVGSKHHGKVVLVGLDKVASTFARTASGTDLRALIVAEAIVLGGEIAEGANADPAIQKVVAWKQAEGVPVLSIGAVVPGCTSALSVPQALQLIAEGKE